MIAVTCATCKHFTSNPRGFGGIGACQLKLPVPAGQMPFYPNAPRECGAHQARQ